VKALIKKTKALYTVYRFLDPHVRRWLVGVSPHLADRYLYRIIFGRPLNTTHPESFNEKIIWLKWHWRDPVLVNCTDKYAVRNHVQERGCAHILNDLYGVYDSVSEIDWEALPQQFVLKCTHGCGCNIVCTDKHALNKEEAIGKLKRWMRTDYSRFMAEMHYRQIKPRIVCEKYLKGEDDRLPTDYKLYCFNGAPKLVLVCTERSSKLALTWRDLDWNLMRIGADTFPPKANQVKPACLEQMISDAEKLSQGIPFVRVDFYNVNGNAVFGEMTFTPAGGFAPYYSEAGDRLLGNLLELPEK
jgi:TupA-like ATPgrasp